MDNNKFSYTYSADSKEEVARIREKYCVREETTLEKIKRLDNGVTNKATMVSIIVGVISSLILGVGMCCCMVWTQFFVLGILVGVIGIAGVCFAYPVYKKVLSKERKKVAPQILALTDEELQKK